jgi:hypothetical protein
LNLAVAGSGFRDLFTADFMEENCPVEVELDMKAKDPHLIIRFGKFALLAAGIVLFLGAINVRSRLRYGGPDYSFLFWIAAYLAVTGIGLIRSRKWALLLLCLPAAFDAAMLIAGYRELAHMAAIGSIILNLFILAVLVIIPINGLHFWSELTWKL